MTVQTSSSSARRTNAHPWAWVLPVRGLGSPSEPSVGGSDNPALGVRSHVPQDPAFANRLRSGSPSTCGHRDRVLSSPGQRSHRLRAPAEPMPNALRVRPPRRRNGPLPGRDGEGPVGCDRLAPLKRGGHSPWGRRHFTGWTTARRTGMTVAAGAGPLSSTLSSTSVSRSKWARIQGRASGSCADSAA